MTSPLPDRAGLDPNFLGIEILLPAPTDPTVATVALTYTHFSVLMRPDRRLAAITGVGIDGASLRQVDRADDWTTDPRLPADQQTGEALYANNDLDRGHLVRRRDPVWGSPTTAEQANTDTFYFTNCAPQAAEFNQDMTLWLGLEDYLLDNAAAFDRRLVVFTGCVLHPDDPTYRDVQIPLQFFKIATFLDAGAPAATGYVLDQTPQVDDLELPRAQADTDVPPLGPYRSFQVPIADIAAATDLDLQQLVDLDRFVALPATQPLGAAGATATRWRRLTTLADIAWHVPSTS